MSTFVVLVFLILMGLLVSRIFNNHRNKANSICSSCGHRFESTDNKLVKVLRGPSPGPYIQNLMCLKCANKLSIGGVVSEIDHRAPLANDIAKNGVYMYKLERSLVSVIFYNSKYYLTFVSDDWFGKVKTYEISFKLYKLIMDNKLKREEILNLLHVH